MTKRLAVLAAFGLLAGTAFAAPPRPAFEDMPRKQERRLLDRVAEAPAPYRRLLRATYPRLEIRALYEYAASYVTTRQRGGEKRHVVHLDIGTRAGGAYGDHLTTHELGHVIANEWFDEADYERFFELFRQSPNWRECFETEPGYPVPCDVNTEILADQLAFYATGNLEFRSSYDIPPLADRAAMTAAIAASD